MREIKFRAWDKDDKKMYEVLSYSPKTFGLYKPHVGVRDIGSDDFELKYISTNFVLLQYTGLKDKNGVEIYEGYITMDNHGTLTVVENDGFQWIERVVKLRDVRINKDFLIMNKVNTFRCEIIGNIYENPELIEGEE